MKYNYIVKIINLFVLLVFALTSCTNPSKIEFLEDLYTNYVFGNNDITKILKENSSKRLLNFLREEYEYECEDGDCYAIWCFRTNAMDSAPGAKVISKVEEIIRLEDDWYRVTYLDMGWKGSTRIKFVKENGKLVMDEIVDELNGSPHDFVREDDNSDSDNKTMAQNQVTVSNDDNSIKSTLTIFGEPAYLMKAEDIENELVGYYYWTIDEVGFGINPKGTLTMINEFVKTIYDDLCTSNINGTIPVKAKYEKGNWYRQENSQNNMTMYYLVGHEVNIELLVYENAVWIGNKNVNIPQEPKGYIMVFKDQQGRWAYKGKNGQFEFNKK